MQSALAGNDGDYSRAVIRLGAMVKDDSLEWDKQTQEINFVATDGTTDVAVQATGAIIVPAEIIENTGQIDHNKLDNYLTSKTRVIIPVHLYGFIGNMNYINK